MANVEVERVAEDGLSRQIWRFHVITGYGNTILRVEYYGRETRSSKRHKWITAPAKRYASFDPRPYNSGIAAKDVPLPDDVAAEAKDRFMHAVVVSGPETR